MRIIAGLLGGRRFDSLPGLSTRPTSDKMRQALFNILYGRLEGARVLDGFAGSGGLSFEALSRGAQHATMVELERAAFSQLLKNAQYLGVQDSVQLLQGNFFTLAPRLGPTPYDLIFFDPPYQQGLLEAALLAVQQHKLLADGGIVVCEHSARPGAPQQAGALARYDTRRYGSAALSFYRADTPKE
ncbi:MAG: 16S rRNA (guanine(966)-N(2))-methyltransferase RsmD [Eubacteriales bacterium]|nr:16S rRNA (guanine(966)-N(2))-methyltransferase RsmD [Eubacteriales bacterium]